MENEGIQGFGIGQKISNDVPTGQLALRVYVEAKRDDVDHPVPREVVAANRNAITDVIEIGRLEPESTRDRFRPLQPGISVGLETQSPGTLGAFVRLPNGGIGMLSNSHVLADNGHANIGDVIVQPGAGEPASTTADSVATLTGFVPFQFTDTGSPNLVDAAVAEINVAHENVFVETGATPGAVHSRLRAGMKVQIVGRTSGHSWGVITDSDFVALLRYRNAAGQKQRVGFRDQVLCTRYTEGGDSGSLVMSSSGRAIGLHFAGSPGENGVSVFNRITHVERELNVELLTD